MCLLTFQLLVAEEIRVAVASNFTHTMKMLAAKFEAQTPHKVILSFGATGRHYAQIKHGAPFDIFFAADSKRPKRLEKEGLIIPKSRYTYALGKLVLWSADTDFIDAHAKVLEGNNYRHIAIANPKLAPYGKAAYEFLMQRRLWKALKRKIVRGENIAQTFQFVKTGNAELGFVALSHIKHLDKNERGSIWYVPENQYTSIKQQVVLLNDNPVAKTFLDFIKTTEAKAIIENNGYASANQK